ncbi:hypothetical protein EYF80_018181 [Liparis tanakae]|uniref:Uncharacterized protein n=1 Tax=Liparis tanakae TaxID=230148 RepID=A0A4Z2I0T3_9TELE|nr:hypothetical protein EYF80_018181 [Liparis tanakae]
MKVKELVVAHEHRLNGEVQGSDRHAEKLPDALQGLSISCHGIDPEGNADLNRSTGIKAECNTDVEEVGSRSQLRTYGGACEVSGGRGSYLLAVSERQDEGLAQGVQVGLRLPQVCQSIIKSHPRWVRPLLLRARLASSLPALLAQLAQGFGGSLYHLRPRLGAQLETR